MNQSFSKIWKVTLLSALLFILLGCFLLMRPEDTLDFIAYVTGGFIIVLGVLALYRHFKDGRSFTFDLAYGAVCIAGALVLFFFKDALIIIIPVVVAIIMVANALLKVPYIFKALKGKMAHWYVLLILALLKIIVAIIVMVDPTEAFISLIQLIGICTITFALLDVIDLILIKIWFNEPLSEEKPQVKDVIENVEVEEIETK